jgi:sulfotransferase famil protein
MFTNHVLQRTVVLPELRVLFLPVPKAGCTSMLWLLADLAGIPAERFARSSQAEVTPALTVHDMGLWAPHRLADFEGAERERVLNEDGWLRFSIVRDPVRRLWSAWQTKLLLREPRFLDAFGDEPWFPRVPERPADLVEDFGHFVAALRSGSVEDVHWGVQHELVGQLPLTHVGRVERYDETVALLRDHIGDRWPGDPARENRSPVPMPADAYDAEGAEVLRARYADDLEAYGYEVPAPAADPDWETRVEPLLPLLRGMMEQHARIGQLQSRLRRAERLPSRPRADVLTNLEGNADYDVRRSDEEVEPGFTAVLRVRDEARSLPFVLPPLLRAVKRVVVIDNRSTDGTGDVARRVAAAEGAADRLEVLPYPFAVARCGAEHLGTPAESVHSLAYFYNWSFSHVRTDYALKWDGDMVLTDSAVAALRALAWQLEATEAVIRIPRHPLYVADERLAFLDVDLRNCEPWGWPNRPEHRFVKAMEWELPLWSPNIGGVTLPERSCVELKYLDADEFDHWSDTDFEASARTRRKRREFEVFNAIAGGGEPPPGVVRIEAPAGQNVIDYVRSSWLPVGSGDAATVTA